MDYNEQNMAPQPAPRPEDVINQQQRKLKMFQENGYPIPMPVVTSVGNPAILNKIQQIKAGLKKNEFEDIIYKEVNNPNAHVNVPLTRKPQHRPQGSTQKPGGPPAPELFSAAPMGMDSSLLEAERLMFGDVTPSRPTIMRPQTQGPVGPGNRIAELSQPTEEEASYATQNIIQKFHSTVAQKQAALQQQQSMMQQNAPMIDQSHQFYPPQQPVQMPYGAQGQYGYPAPQPILPQGSIIINEEDLKKKIINISSQVAKKISEQMIKTVLSEYLKQSKNTIVESERVKKAEVVGENVVKIDGKIFKLVPATVKVKE